VSEDEPAYAFQRIGKFIGPLCHKPNQDWNKTLREAVDRDERRLARYSLGIIVKASRLARAISIEAVSSATRIVPRASSDWYIEGTLSIHVRRRRAGLAARKHTAKPIQSLLLPLAYLVGMQFMPRLVL